MATIFACTHVSKDVEQDDFEKGCIGPRTCVMDESCNLEAPNLEALIDRLRRHYCLALDDLWMPDEDGIVERIGYNRLEDSDGNEVLPDDAEYAEWKAGKIRCYLADYDFSIERRETVSITVDDFVSAGIRYHN